ncbi:MAG: hypothetical protein ABGX27_00175, partial [Desulfurobacteriaceae bacterium]
MKKTLTLIAITLILQSHQGKATEEVLGKQEPLKEKYQPFLGTLKEPSPSPYLPLNCIKLLKKITPKQSKLNFRLKAFATLRKDIPENQSYYYEPPVNLGVRIEIPLIDTRERYKLKKQYLQDLKNAEKLLENYLSTKAEVEETKNYIAW